MKHILFSTLLAISLAGCAIAPVVTSSADSSKAIILNFEQSEGDQVLSSRVAYCDGNPIFLLDFPLLNLKGYQVPAGEHRLAFEVAWKQKGLFAQRSANLGRGVIKVNVLAGHRYKAEGKYLFGEMMCRFSIVDQDSGERISEYVDVPVNAIAVEWVMIIL